ncbi:MULTISPECIES: hypothetical protein [Bacillus cereus group]|uniref:hypothetical protein n=1 Tax=Bacillus cereus group TaxID=86661 RepID=UPI001643630C|nr:hypothetical protein [Bacillus thuringiensis]MCQ6305782.1 hypothetical protein [Bacillus cereus]
MRLSLNIVKWSLRTILKLLIFAVIISFAIIKLVFFVILVIFSLGAFASKMHKF